MTNPNPDIEAIPTNGAVWAALIRVDAPANTWCMRMKTAWPTVRYRILSAYPHPPGGMIELVVLAGPQWKAALNDLRGFPGVFDAEVLQDAPESATVRLRVRDCGLIQSVAEAGIVPNYPFDGDRGSDRWLLVGPQNRVREALARLNALSAPVQVLYSGNYSSRRRLTERQRAVLSAAVDHGYYDYPRRITLTQLAGKLGVAKSTLSELLMLIERQVMAEARQDHEAGSRANGEPRTSEVLPSPGEPSRRPHPPRPGWP